VFTLEQGLAKHTSWEIWITALMFRIFHSNFVTDTVAHVESINIVFLKNVLTFYKYAVSMNYFWLWKTCRKRKITSNTMFTDRGNVNLFFEMKINFRNKALENGRPDTRNSDVNNSTYIITHYYVHKNERIYVHTFCFKEAVLQNILNIISYTFYKISLKIYIIVVKKNYIVSLFCFENRQFAYLPSGYCFYT